MRSPHIFFLSFLAICLASATAICQPANQVYLFSYFKGNGEDGLHLAFSRDGMQWNALHHDSSFLKPAVGKEKLMRDPCIIRGNDGNFHLVWTASWKDKGIGYAQSKDLVHWSEQKFLPVMEHEAGALNCWAPEITYDKEMNQYIIYWATTIPGRFPNTETTGDDKYNHRIYYITTRNFKQFSKTGLLYDKGFNVIDATIVPDEKQYVMFLKDETRYPREKNIRVATSAKATGPYSAPSVPITDTSYWAEGPTILRINSKWVVYFDKYREGKMGAVQSGDLGNWKDISNEVHFPKGTRHGTVFSISQTEWARLSELIKHL